uniref:Transposase n=1 Tax=Heterorhabditis bacteriophora TaxID=37862 RepID=A0A1I7WN06_HETBA
MSKGKNITPNQRVMVKVLLEQNLVRCRLQKACDTGKCPSYQEKSKYYRKDRWNNSSAMRGQPSINCQGHPLRSENLSTMLTEYHANSTTFELEAVIKKVWAHISVQRCVNLVDYATTLCYSYQEFRVSYEVLVMY